MFNFKFRNKEDEDTPLSVKGALEELERNQVEAFTNAYKFITNSNRAKAISVIFTVFTYILWFLVFNFYRYLNGVENTDLLNLYHLIPISKDNLFLNFIFNLISTVITAFLLLSATTFMLERLKLEIGISKGKIKEYLKRNTAMPTLLISFSFTMLFVTFIIMDMYATQNIARDISVHAFMLITTFVYHYNRLMFRFAKYHKDKVLTTYIEALSSIIEEEEREENKTDH